MRPDVLPYLRCPVCGQQLIAAETDHPHSGATTPHPSRPEKLTARALRCPRGHSFDLARQGYVNLNAGRAPQTGDSAEMVGARADFLAAGHYDFVSAALCEAAVREAARIAAAAPHRGGQVQPYPDLVVDAGAGTGRHLAAVLDTLPAAVGLALDASKPALRRAARAHPRASAALCDTWRRLPMADGSAALLLNVFAPRNGPEFHRVLRRDGALLVATPTADHLHELVERLGLLRVDPGKADRVAGSLGAHFQPAGQTSHHHRLALSRHEVQTLVAMGPSAWHTDPVRLAQRLDALPEPVPVTASIRLTVYRPHPIPHDLAVLAGDKRG